MQLNKTSPTEPGKRFSVYYERANAKAFTTNGPIALGDKIATALLITLATS